jgi:phospholipid/cholesterol/gamma-HCH transport system ATP-binding protein
MLRLENVHKRYGEQEVLRGITFRVREGSVTTMIGRSGSGKSVLLRHLIGLERPDSGSIFIDSEDIAKMSDRDLNRVRRRFGVLFQDAALLDFLSARENVAFPIREHLKLSEKEIQDLVDEKLGKVGMLRHADKFPSELSGGMRKRTGLARALALDPEIVFFDEPTRGLDPITRGVIYRLIEDTHSERSMTYFIASHDIEGALEFSDEVMMLYEGKIIEHGTPEEIRHSTDPVLHQFIWGSAEGPITIE